MKIVATVGEVIHDQFYYKIDVKAPKCTLTEIIGTRPATQDSDVGKYEFSIDVHDPITIIFPLFKQNQECSGSELEYTLVDKDGKIPDWLILD